MEKIGKVELDYTFYKGNDLYSDGKIEDVILEAYKSGKQDELLRESDDWAVLYHISKVRENIINWYPISKDADVLEIGAGCGAITGVLARKARTVTCVDLSKRRSTINGYKNSEYDNIKILVGNFKDVQIEQKYDYITLIGVLEYAALYEGGPDAHIRMLQQVQQYLKPNGKIIIAIENKVGLKYWNGAGEDHTGTLYDGLMDYVRTDGIRTFSQKEIREIAKKCNIENISFYYPMPDYKMPEMIFTSSYLPKPSNLRFDLREYSIEKSLNFEEHIVYDQLCHDDMFQYFANSFLCVFGEDKTSLDYAKFCVHRKQAFDIVTEIKTVDGRKKVVKSPKHSEAKPHILSMKEKEQKWKGMLSNITYLQGEIIGDTYQCEFVDGCTLEEELFAYRNNVDTFLLFVHQDLHKYYEVEDEKLGDFYETENFRAIFGTCGLEQQKTLPVTNIDFIFQNLIKQSNGTVVNIDYEWVYDFPIPYKYVIWRCLISLYRVYALYIQKYMTEEEFFLEFGLTDTEVYQYQRMESRFREYVFHMDNGDFCLNKYKKRASVKQGLRGNELKIQQYYSILNLWMEKREQGIKISDYLENKNMNKVAIYGASNLGRHLINELKNTDVAVNYVIDKNVNIKDLQTVSPDCCIEDVDAIIVTACYYFEEIKKKLEKNNAIPIVSLDTIVHEM